MPDEVAARAHELARTLADGFKLAGTLAIELFVTPDGRVLVNELAPRHNSGHYTIEACWTSSTRTSAASPARRCQPKLLSRR